MVDRNDGIIVYMISYTYIENILFNFLAFNILHVIYVNKIALGCGPHSNDNENVKQKAKLSLAFVVKKYLQKFANYLERSLGRNNNE